MLLGGGLLLLTFLMSALVVTGTSAAAKHREAERGYVHTFDVLLAAGNFRASAYAAVRGEHRYLLTGNPRFLEPYFEARQQGPALAERLRTLTRDNPGQQSNLARLIPRMKSYYDVLAAIIALEASGRHDAALATVRNGNGTSLNNLLATINDVEMEERRLMAARRIESDRAYERLQQQGLALIALGILLLVATAAAALFGMRAHRRAIQAAADLRRVATTDELTGLPNRRAFLAALESESARSMRTGSPLCVAIVDVDRFKRINDTYGHPAGDEVLRQVTATIRAALRNVDTLGRIGGEEFAILMPETSRPQAEIVSERLRHAVATTPIMLASGDVISATLSAGLAIKNRNETSADLIARADIALYAAKRGGRNIVRLAA